MDIENDKNIKKPWWREGVLLSAKVSAYIAVPVIIASYVGKNLDKKYDSSPYIFLFFVAIAFLITIYLIWRETKAYQKRIEADEKSTKEKNDLK